MKKTAKKTDAKMKESKKTAKKEPSGKKLPAARQDELLAILKRRFEKHAVDTLDRTAGGFFLCRHKAPSLEVQIDLRDDRHHPQQAADFGDGQKLAV